MKKTVKALAVFLAVFFCFSALILTVGAADPASSVAKGETFYFGMYPQTCVQDKALTDKLDKISGSTDTEVVTLGGATYASYCIVTNENPGGPFGIVYGYEAFKTYWFRCEPIAWRVLDSGADGVLLLSEYVLGARAFNEAIRADNTWENSDIRTWLNGTFLKSAFTAKEQAFLLTSSLTNEPNPIRGTYDGEPSSYAGDYRGGVPFVGTTSGGPTTDKVFLPSFNEITNPDYGFNVGWKYMKGDFGEPVGYYESDTEPGEHCGRSTSATDYAQCQGAWTHLEVDTNKPLDTCFYWLRTAGYDNTCSAGVLPDGRVSTGWPVNYEVLGIRPMIRVAADAVADSSSDGSGNSGAVTDPADPSDPGKPTDPTDPTDPSTDAAPVLITAPAGDVHYKDSVQFKADSDVIWSSSDPAIAEIDENGNVTIHAAGSVTITATSKETGEKVDTPLEITYLWWQKLIMIFLFGWLWY